MYIRTSSFVPFETYPIFNTCEMNSRATVWDRNIVDLDQLLMDMLLKKIRILIASIFVTKNTFSHPPTHLPHIIEEKIDFY